MKQDEIDEAALPASLRTLIIAAAAAFLWALVLFPLWVLVR